MNIQKIRRSNLRHKLSSLKKTGVTTEKVALGIGSSKSSLSQVIGKNPTRNVGDDLARRVEAFLTLPSGWMDLVHPEVDYEGTNQKNAFTLGVQAYMYPLISFAEATHFSKAINTEERIPSHKKTQGNGFWLKVEGDSMTAPMGTSPSFPSGMLILIDTGAIPKNGDCCLVEYDSLATFKKLTLEEGVTYLKSLNSTYPMIQLNEKCKIIGKVIAAIWANL